MRKYREYIIAATLLTIVVIAFLNKEPKQTVFTITDVKIYERLYECEYIKNGGIRSTFRFTPKQIGDTLNIN